MMRLRRGLSPTSRRRNHPPVIMRPAAAYPPAVLCLLLILLVPLSPLSNRRRPASDDETSTRIVLAASRLGLALGASLQLPPVSDDDGDGENDETAAVDITSAVIVFHAVTTLQNRNCSQNLPDARVHTHRVFLEVMLAIRLHEWLTWRILNLHNNNNNNKNKLCAWRHNMHPPLSSPWAGRLIRRRADAT